VLFSHEEKMTSAKMKRRNLRMEIKNKASPPTPLQEERGVE
jgi:hypothetical protein